MSTRSRLRPSTRKDQPSSRAQRRVGEPGEHRGRAPSPSGRSRAGVRPDARRAWLGSVWCVVLSDSHISDEIASRAPRAFSHAAPSDDVIDAGFFGSNERNSVTPSASGAAIERVRVVAHRAQQARARRRPRRPTGPRAGGGSGRRAGARCPRPARSSGRSSTATPRSGSARRAPALTAAVAAAWALRRAADRARRRSGWSAARPRRAARVRDAARARRRRVASTHVSLDPPPWLEFTTRLPSGSATRVSPPGTTQTSLAVVDRERAQVEVAWPHRVVDVRRCGRERDRLPARSTRAGSRRISLPTALRASRRRRAGPITSPCPPEPSTGFTTSWSRRSSTHSHDVGLLEPVRLDVREHRLLAEVVLDHVGHVRVERLVVADAVADRVRDRHVARARRVHDAGTAEHRVAPEVQRVEVVVVDAAVDDVDALQPLGRAHRDDVVVAHEVAALDQLDAHLPGEERVLEVRGVVDAGREHDDTRVVDTGRGRAAAPRAAASGSRRPAGPGGSRTARGTPGSSPGGSRSRTRCPTACAGCPRAPGTGPRRRARGRCRRRGPAPRRGGVEPGDGPVEVRGA